MNNRSSTRRIRPELPMRAQSQASLLLERVLSEGGEEDQPRPTLHRTRTELPQQQQQRSKEQRVLGANKHSPAALLLKKVLYEDDDECQEDPATAWRRRPRPRRSRTSPSTTTTTTSTTPTSQRLHPAPHPSYPSTNPPTQTPAPAHFFPLLSLPLELRLRIYALLPRRTRLRRSDRDYPYRGRVFSPTLLRVCSTIYKEALPELYRPATLSLRADYFQNYLRPSRGRDPGPPFWPVVPIAAAPTSAPAAVVGGVEGDEVETEVVVVGDPRPRASFVGEMYFRCHDISTFPVSWPQSRVDRFVAALRLAPQLQGLTLRTTDNLWLRKRDKHVLYAIEVLRQIRNAGGFELKIVLSESGSEDSAVATALREVGFCVVREGMEGEDEGGEMEEVGSGGMEEEEEVLEYWGASTRRATLRI